MTKRQGSISLFALALALAACGGGAKEGELTGSVQADGSSTVYPITEAVAEEFGAATQGNVRVTVGTSGTGGGFKRFCAGDTDISNASRPIKESEEEACRQAGVEPVRFDVAYDGVAIVVNPANDFVDCLTVEELKKIWEPGSTVTTWADIRAGWPSEEIELYGPGTDSGTFDYFTEAIMGEEDASRPDYTASEDDNVLVQGVTGDRGALGYFGFAYLMENVTRVKAVPVDNGSGCIAPTVETIKNQTYAPLARPIFIYSSRKAMARPEVAEFLRFYMENAPLLVGEVGYIPLEAEKYQEGLDKIGAPGAAAE